MLFFFSSCLTACNIIHAHNIQYKYTSIILMFLESQIIHTIIYLQCSSYGDQVFNKTISFTSIQNIWITIFHLRKQNWHQLVRHIGIKLCLQTGSFRTCSTPFQSIRVLEHGVHSITRNSRTVFWVFQCSKWSSPSMANKCKTFQITWSEMG